MYRKIYSHANSIRVMMMIMSTCFYITKINIFVLVQGSGSSEIRAAL